MSLKQDITDYVRNADYENIILCAKTAQAQTLKYVQMHIYGDYNASPRWYAIDALGKLAEVYAKENDEAYRNVLRRCLWAMNDESGNVPWSAPEVMAVIIKAAPKQYKEDFFAPMLTNGLDNPMCHRGVLWAMGYLGEMFQESLAPFLPQVAFALDSKDGDLRGHCIWAYRQADYHLYDDKIAALSQDDTEFMLYEQGKLTARKIKELCK